VASRWKWALLGAGILLALEVLAFVLLSYGHEPNCTPRVWFAGSTAVVSCF
jgi:hypothetical protein